MIRREFDEPGSASVVITANPSETSPRLREASESGIPYACVVLGIGGPFRSKWARRPWGRAGRHIWRGLQIRSRGSRRAAAASRIWALFVA